ncbi:unnamed protein product [Lampetra planeri]
MALVTVQRSPTPSTTSSPSVSEVDSGDEERRSQHRSLSESFFTVKGAALFLPRGNGSTSPRASHRRSKHAGDLQQHLQAMLNILRAEDNIKLAVRLESGYPQRTRYMVVVYTNGRQDTEESIVLGMDFPSRESNTCTIGLVLPLWSDTKIHLDGDGGFSVTTVNRTHIFKPVSVQAMWSALQCLHKTCEMARINNYYPGSLFLTWVGYYESRINSEQSCVYEWNAMHDLQSMRSDSPVLFTDQPTERERTEKLLRTKLREIMMQKDLENITSKEIRTELEMLMNCNLKEYREFIDNEMIVILGQMDGASEIFDHVYLGSEWNASNLEELQSRGVGYILNVTREIDNFFPGLFVYHNIRVYDEEATDLLAYWNDTFKFISKAKKSGSKCLVHCKMGVSRSASTVIAYAMKEYGWSLDKAFNFVKEKRNVAKPNASFMRQLEEYQGILDASKQRHNKLWRSHSDSNLSEPSCTREDGTVSKGAVPNLTEMVRPITMPSPGHCRKGSLGHDSTTSFGFSHCSTGASDISQITEGRSTQSRSDAPHTERDRDKSSNSLVNLRRSSSLHTDRTMMHGTVRRATKELEERFKEHEPMASSPIVGTSLSRKNSQNDGKIGRDLVWKSRKGEEQSGEVEVKAAATQRSVQRKPDWREDEQHKDDIQSPDQELDATKTEDVAVVMLQRAQEVCPSKLKEAEPFKSHEPVYAKLSEVSPLVSNVEHCEVIIPEDIVVDSHCDDASDVAPPAAERADAQPPQRTIEIIEYTPAVFNPAMKHGKGSGEPSTVDSESDNRASMEVVFEENPDGSTSLLLPSRRPSKLYHQESLVFLEEKGLVKKHTKELNEKLSSPSSSVKVALVGDEAASTGFARQGEEHVTNSDEDLAEHNADMRTGRDVEIPPRSTPFCLLSLSVAVRDAPTKIESEKAVECRNVTETDVENKHGISVKPLGTSETLVHDKKSSSAPRPNLQLFSPTPYVGSSIDSLQIGVHDALSSGRVRQQAKEIESKNRQAGLTTPSRMKRSHSLAKLGSFGLCQEDMNDEASLDPVEPMELKRVLSTERSGQREPSQGERSSVIICSTKPIDILAHDDGNRSQLPVLQTQRVESSAGDDAHGSQSIVTAATQDAGSSVQRQQHGRTHPLRRLKKTSEKKRTTNPLYNTV